MGARRTGAPRRLAEQAASAANRRDWDVLLAGLAPDVDYHVDSVGPGGFVAPDLVYLHVWHTRLDGFADLTLEPSELVDAGDRLMSASLLRGHGSASGVPIEQVLYQVFILRRGLVVKQEDYGERDAALNAMRLDGAAIGAPRAAAVGDEPAG